MDHKCCLGYQVATPDVEPIPKLTALTGDIEKNLELLRETGYDAVEFMTSDPDQLNAEYYKRLLEKYCLNAVMICTGELYGTLHLSFTDPDEEGYRNAVDRVRKIIDFAEILGANINIGRVRGLLNDDLGRRYQAAAAFREIAGYAAMKNVKVLLEPVEAPWCDWVHTVHEAQELAGEVGDKYFRVMADYACMQKVEDPFLRKETCDPRLVNHIHLTEKDRMYPGYHDTEPFKKFISQCRNQGYDGPFVMEIYQYPDPETAVREAYKTIAPILKEVYSQNF